MFRKPPYYLTAYGLAVREGFKGTLEQWLESLRGEKGDGVELRYQDDKLQWRSVPPEGAQIPEDWEEDEWKDLLELEDIRGPVVEQTLEQAQQAAQEATEAAGEAELMASHAQGHEQMAAQYAQEALEAARFVAVTTEYAVSEDGSTPPKAWETDIPELTAKKPFLWVKVNKNYTDGTAAADVGVIGRYSADGKDGSSTTITLKYGVSSTPSMNTVTGWQDTIPQMSETYPYLWIEITTETTTATGGSSTIEAGIIGYYSTPGSGLSDTEKKLMLTLFKNAGYADDSMLDTYNELATLWGGETVEPEEPDEPVVPDEPDEPDEPEKTLSSISATYSGGDVAVGTAVTALTGIVVTAHYSDGTSETVTGYTLSGTIAEGSNTVTVSYGGKTTTFSVTGVAESGGDGNFISIPVTQHTGAIVRNIFADDGTTPVRDGTFQSWCWISEETFEQDTRVKFFVTPGWPGTRNSRIFAGSAVSATDLNVYFVEGVKGETTEDASYDGSTVEKIVTVKAGHKAILVYSNGIVVTAAMEADIVRCTGISLSADTLEFTGEGSKTLIATVTPNNCTQPVFWESSNPNIVTVENGVVTALNNGKEIITVRCGAYSASCSVSASGFVVAPLCPLADGTCTVTGNTGSGETGKITITNGNHINMTRTWAYNPVIPASDLPETRKQNEGGMVCNSELFPLKTGDEVRTVVRFSDTNAHVAGLSVRLYASTGVWNEYIEVLTGITESGEATYTVEADWSAGGIAVYLEAGTGVLDCDIEIYVNGARYV